MSQEEFLLTLKISVTGLDGVTREMTIQEIVAMIGDVIKRSEELKLKEKKLQDEKQKLEDERRNYDDEKLLADTKARHQNNTGMRNEDVTEALQKLHDEQKLLSEQKKQLVEIKMQLEADKEELSEKESALAEIEKKQSEERDRLDANQKHIDAEQRALSEERDQLAEQLADERMKLEQEWEKFAKQKCEENGEDEKQLRIAVPGLDGVVRERTVEEITTLIEEVIEKTEELEEKEQALKRTRAPPPPSLGKGTPPSPRRADDEASSTPPRSPKSEKKALASSTSEQDMILQVKIMVIGLDGVEREMTIAEIIQMVGDVVKKSEELKLKEKELEELKQQVDMKTQRQAKEAQEKGQDHCEDDHLLLSDMHDHDDFEETERLITELKHENQAANEQHKIDAETIREQWQQLKKAKETAQRRIGELNLLQIALRDSKRRNERIKDQTEELEKELEKYKEQLRKNREAKNKFMDQKQEWTIHVHKDKVYYQNAKTGKSQWQKPEEKKDYHEWNLIEELQEKFNTNDKKHKDTISVLEEKLNRSEEKNLAKDEEIQSLREHRNSSTARILKMETDHAKERLSLKQSGLSGEDTEFSASQDIDDDDDEKHLTKSQEELLKKLKTMTREELERKILYMDEKETELKLMIKKLKRGLKVFLFTRFIMSTFLDQISSHRLMIPLKRVSVSLFSFYVG
uniref:WW domain-containing protein n=1 Tax=Lotharella globosa TaxID=91324 RepID=A0A7S4DVK8_9EUKA